MTERHDSNSLQPWQERVIAEKADLDERLNKLRAFIITGAASLSGVGDAELERLRRQQVVMQEYASILQQRIEAWT